MVIYLDESGDLGWKFNKPYRFGGSSRYLTIGYIVVPVQKKDLPRRVVFDVYKKFKFDPSKEIKGSDLSNNARSFFVKKTIAMLEKHADITLGAITVKKDRVFSHMQEDPNKLYNYMINMGMICIVEKHEGNLHFIRDQRSIKVASGNSLVDYLQIKLWYEMGSKAKLIDKPTDSKSNTNLFFIDWVCNTIWSNYEDNETDISQALISKTINKKFLF